MKCYFCGAEIDDGVKFCKFCGQSVENPPEEIRFVQNNTPKKTCSYCGHLLRENVKFCPNCGASADGKISGFGDRGTESKTNEGKTPANDGVEPQKPEPVKPVPAEPVKPVPDEPVKPVQPEPVKPVQPEPVKPVINGGGGSVTGGNTPGKGSGGNKPSGSPILLVGLVIAAIAVGLIAGNAIGMFGKKDSGNNDQGYNISSGKDDNDSYDSYDNDSYDSDNNDSNDNGLSGYFADDDNDEGNNEVIDEDHYQELDYVGAKYPNYPSGTSDYTMVSCPNGVYSMMYPKDFFYTGYYDYDDSSYHFATADGSVTLTIVEYEAPIKNNPKSCANSLLLDKKSYINTKSIVEKYYEYASKEVAESGYSRAIVAGQLKSDPSTGVYICHACNNSTVYELKITVPLDVSITNGRGVDYTPTGYILDCVYRGWSISGSTYRLRTYDEYMVDDMGTKK